MSEPPVPAVREALALLRAPRRPRPDGEDRLPEGVLALLRIAAGEADALESAAASTAESATAIQEAACFYIQQVMFAPGSNSFRVMGVDPDASDERIREHYRWLARWLHPDRNPNQWEGIYAERVNQAWQHLRTQERRLKYEQTVQRPGFPDPTVQRGPMQGPRISRAPETAPAPVNLRWLPSAILVGLGLCVLGLVSLLYIQNLPETAQASAIPPPEMVAPHSFAAERPEVPLPRGEAALASPSIELSGLQPAATSKPQIALAVQVPSPMPLELAQARILPPAPSLAAPVPPPPRPLAAPRTPLVSVEKESRPVATVLRASEPVARRVEHDSSPRQLPAVPLAAAAVALFKQVEAPEERAAAAHQPAVQNRDANRLMMRFSQAYEAGDLASLREMFAADASGARGNLDSILSDYEQVFRNSSERSLSVRDVNWFMSGDTLTILASFQATVSGSRRNRSRKTHGDIRFDLRRQGDQWRIYRLKHAEHPG